MKKIERYRCLGVAVIDGTDRGLTKYWAVLKSDLDAQEAYIKQLEDGREKAIAALTECKSMIDGLTYGTGRGKLSALINELKNQPPQEKE